MKVSFEIYVNYYSNHRYFVETIVLHVMIQKTGDPNVIDDHVTIHNELKNVLDYFSFST